MTASTQGRASIRATHSVHYSVRICTEIVCRANRQTIVRMTCGMGTRYMTCSTFTVTLDRRAGFACVAPGWSILRQRRAAAAELAGIQAQIHPPPG